MQDPEPAGLPGVLLRLRRQLQCAALGDLVCHGGASLRLDWWVGGLVGWWVGGLVGWWVGGLVGWWVGGLVGWWVGGGNKIPSSFRCQGLAREPLEGATARVFQTHHTGDMHHLAGVHCFHCGDARLSGEQSLVQRELTAKLGGRTPSALSPSYSIPVTQKASSKKAKRKLLM